MKPTFSPAALALAMGLVLGPLAAPLTQAQQRRNAEPVQRFHQRIAVGEMHEYRAMRLASGLRDGRSGGTCKTMLGHHMQPGLQQLFSRGFALKRTRPWAWVCSGRCDAGRGRWGIH